MALVGLDGDAGGLQAGAMARVQQSDQERTVALTDLEVVDADTASAEWLAAY